MATQNLKPFTKSAFSTSVRDNLEKLKITFLGSFLVLFSIRSLLNFYCWMEYDLLSTSNLKRRLIFELVKKHFCQYDKDLDSDLYCRWFQLEEYLFRICFVVGKYSSLSAHRIFPMVWLFVQLEK